MSTVPPADGTPGEGPVDASTSSQPTPEDPRVRPGRSLLWDRPFKYPARRPFVVRGPQGQKYDTGRGEKAIPTATDASIATPERSLPDDVAIPGEGADSGGVLDPLHRERAPQHAVTTRELPSRQTRYFRLGLSTTVAIQVIGEDPKRRSILILNEDATNVVSISGRAETTTSAGTLTFTLGPGTAITLHSMDAVWAIAQSGTPFLSVAIEMDV